MHLKFVRSLAIIICAMSLNLQAQIVERLVITLSKQEVTTEETFQMVVSASRVGEQDDLDVSALTEDFEVINIEFDKYSYLMNQQLSNSSTWIITLRPKKKGELTIPSVKLGNTMSPEDYIEVVDVDEELAKKGPPLRIETRLSRSNAFIGQDVLYTILVYQEPDVVARRIYQNFPTEINATQLGKDEYIIEYEVGKPVKFSRRYYLLNGLKQGSYDIPAPTFTGVARTRNRGNFGRVFSTEEDVSVVGNLTSIVIEPLPQQTNEKTVLASNIEMTASWQSDSFKVGEPNLLTVSLRAIGINPERLPNVLINLPESLRGYPENTTREMSVLADDIEANLTSTIAIIPTVSGGIVIPDIAIDWYNVESNALDSTVLAFNTLTIKENTTNSKTSSTALNWYTDFRLYLVLCLLLLITYVVHIRKLKTELVLQKKDATGTDSPLKLNLNSVILAKQDKHLPSALKAYLDNKLSKQPSLTHHQRSDSLQRVSPELCSLIAQYFDLCYSIDKRNAQLKSDSFLDDEFYQSLSKSLAEFEVRITKHPKENITMSETYIY